MKFWSHHNNEEKGLWRGWFHLQKDDSGSWKSEIIGGALEVVYGRRARHHVGFRLHIGNKGSETPFDWDLGLWFIAFFGSFQADWLRSFCQWVGRGHKRDISLSIHGGQMWWKLWYDDDMGYDNHHRCDKRRTPWWWPFKNERYRSWMCLREGNIPLNLLDTMWGLKFFHYEEIDRREDLFGVYQFEDDVYDLIFILRRVRRYREKGPFWARRVKDMGYEVEWEMADRHSGGIPVRNHEWKGDGVYASAVKIDDTKEWLGQAHKKLQEWVIQQRERYNYQPPRTSQDDLIDQKVEEFRADMEDKHRQIDDISLYSLSLDPEPNAFGESVQIETGYIDKIDGDEVTLEQINTNRAKDGLDPLPKEG